MGKIWLTRSGCNPHPFRQWATANALGLMSLCLEIWSSPPTTVLHLASLLCIWSNTILGLPQILPPQLLPRRTAPRLLPAHTLLVLFGLGKRPWARLSTIMTLTPREGCILFTAKSWDCPPHPCFCQNSCTVIDLCVSALGVRLLAIFLLYGWESVFFFFCYHYHWTQTSFFQINFFYLCLKVAEIFWRCRKLPFVSVFTQHSSGSWPKWGSHWVTRVFRFSPACSHTSSLSLELLHTCYHSLSSRNSVYK